MTTKHTPGPWQFGYSRSFDSDAGEYSRILHLIVGDRVIPLAYSGIAYAPENNFDEWEANARIMSAAPDLLRELEEAPIPSQYHGERGFEVERFLADYEHWMAQRRAAIAKAKGEA